MIRRKYLADPCNAPGAFYARHGAAFSNQPKTEEDLTQAIQAVASDDSGNLRYGGQERKVIVRIRAAQGGGSRGCDALELETAGGSLPARAVAGVMKAIPASWLRRLRVFAPETRKDAK